MVMIVNTNSVLSNPAFRNATDYLLEHVAKPSTKEDRVEAWKFYFNSILVLDHDDGPFIEFASEADYLVFTLKWG